MTMIALVLTLSLHAFIKEQTLTLAITASSNNQLEIAFSSTKWKPVDGRSLIVETVRNYLPEGDVIYSYPSSSSGTALRASLTPEGIVLPGRVTNHWTTYRTVKEVAAGPRYFFSHEIGKVAQNSGRCWNSIGEANGKVEQTLQACLQRDDRELFSCISTIEADKDGAFVICYKVRNHSAKDATFEWGAYKGSVLAGKMLEYSVKSAAAPKEAERHCSVSFANDAVFAFRANAWASP